MANVDRDQPEVADMFERMLLDSARSDSVSPEATEQAWLRFSGLLAGAALSASGGHAAAQSVAGWGVLSRLGVGKYLLIGALGGSALTFAWFGSQRASQRARERSVVAPPTAQPSVNASQSSRDSAPLLSPDAAPARATPSRVRLAASSANARQREPTLPKAARPSAPENSKPESASAPSTLIAEVAALDAARAATRAGAYNRALALLGQYQADFPAGILSADAEVATIEALYEKGDRAEASRRAAQFLVQFPNDLHSRAVRRLLTP
jgi:hypothetical protein